MNPFLQISSKKLSVFMILFLVSYGPIQAQSYETAGEYMNYISTQFTEIVKDYWSYTSAVGHGKSARKVEGKRKELLATNQDVTRKIQAMPPFKGDKSYRDSMVAYLRKSYHVLNHDYAKIVNMEEISEQSYDAMEAYLLAQDVASEKMSQAGDRLRDTQKAFADKNNIQIVEGESEIGKKLEAAAELNAYHRVVYLIFFKSYKQEAYMLDALNKKNVSAVEQNRNTLLQFSTEGLAKLDTMKGFKGDKSLINACKQMLEFYKSECKDKVGILTNYFMKEDSFQKTKKAFDAKKPADRKQEDVDQFNKGVEELNKAANEFNTTNTQLGDNRNKLIDNWNKTSQNFLDKYTPKN
jgi:hypothetical protein